MEITLAFADDHVGLRSAFAKTVEAHGPFKTIMEADNGKQIICQLQEATILPDICVLDLRMPQLDGIDTLKAIREIFPTQKVLVYSMFLEEYNFRRIYKYGANGAISKDCGLVQFIDALLQTYQEDIYIPPGISKVLTEAIQAYNIQLPRISQREIEFLRLYCSGFSYKEIADKMDISVKTVDVYRVNLCRKLQIKSKNGLYQFASKTGIVGWNF